MNNNNDSIKQENRKAIPKFLLISAGGAVLGAVLGIVLVLLSLENFADTLAAAGAFFTGRMVPWLLIALPVVELAVCLPIYFGAKRQFAAWDGEDEDASGRIEVRLAVCLWITSTITILDFFLVAAHFSGFVERAGDPMRIGPVLFFGGLAAFLVTLYLSTVLQQKIVDITKRMNPEKHGSVYDTKFQKTWYESCDEAERAIIGQCALKAFQATTVTCLVLWAVLALGGMFFGWGFLPAMVVCIVWGVNQSVYIYWSLKLGQPGRKV